MNQIRAIIDGKIKFGRYVQINGLHLIVTDEAREHVRQPGIRVHAIFGVIEIPDISLSLCAVATGYVDSFSKEMYGSKDKMRGGDKVKAWIYSDEEPQELFVEWLSGAWGIEYKDSESDRVLIYDFVGSLEII